MPVFDVSEMRLIIVLGWRGVNQPLCGGTGSGEGKGVVWWMEDLERVGRRGGAGAGGGARSGDQP